MDKIRKILDEYDKKESDELYALINDEAKSFELLDILAEED